MILKKSYKYLLIERIMRQKIYNIIEPGQKEHRNSVIYDRIMLIAIVVSIIPLMFRSSNIFFEIVEYIVTFLFGLDYILRWATADIRMQKNKVLSFLIYPFTPVAIIDLISILPIIGSVNNSLRILRTWRLIRIIRVAKIFKYYEPLQIVIEVFRKKSSVLFTVVGFALFYIFITALFMFNVEQAINPQTGDMFFEDFFDALYWSTCTLTTVGYGDIYPISDVGRIVSMVSSLVGIAIIALPSGIITAGYLEEINERKSKEKQNYNF